MIFNIVIFLLVLSVLVFVHELGHFVAAKACGIYCDRFSLGMPPRVFGFKWGETDYCVGALPLGGYVKMAGQEDAPQSDELRQDQYGHVPPERWFSSKPVWQRTIVIVAGPLMNLVLAVVLFGVAGAVGAYVTEAEVTNRIGLVAEASPAEQAPMYLIPAGAERIHPAGEPDAVGWQTGDRIISIDGQRMDTIGDVAVTALLGKGNVLDVVIERVGDDGVARRYLSPVAPKVLEEDGQYAKFGVAPFQAALVQDVIPDMPAAQQGIQPGDEIVRANGDLIDRVTLSVLVENLSPGDQLELEVKRDAETFVLSPQLMGRFKDIIFTHELAAEDVDPDAHPEIFLLAEEVKERTGLQQGDVITEIEGQPATVAWLRELERSRPGESIRITVERPTILLGLIQRAKTLSLELPSTAVPAIGVIWETKTVFHRTPARQVLPAAFQETYLTTKRTYQILGSLFRGVVGPKELGGPVMIAQVTIQAAHEGYYKLLKMAAFISVNLAVFNLLPLPVLDGGQLVVLGLEAVRRRPLDIRILERVQQFGLLLILALILFVTFNDVSRWFLSKMP
jgi:regulator of sigma E protease